MTREAYRFEPYLHKIIAKKGVFAILGNHDYGDYYKWKSKGDKDNNFQDLLDFYKRIGWKLLRNESVVIEKGGDKILLSGVENWGNMKRYQKLADVPKAIHSYEQIPFKILLSHNPVHWERKLQNYPQTIDLCLSGHTHGGQIGVELNGFRWSPIQYLYRYWAGVYQETNQATDEIQTLYVNRGIGSIAYPGRIGILPEITIIELS
jgi:predicted MPP superfamily phosphohydrolase